MFISTSPKLDCEWYSRSPKWPPINSYASQKNGVKVHPNLQVDPTKHEQWKNPGWLGYIGDEQLPRYIGIITYHYKNPY